MRVELIFIEIDSGLENATYVLQGRLLHPDWNQRETIIEKAPSSE